MCLVTWEKQRFTIPWKQSKVNNILVAWPFRLVLVFLTCPMVILDFCDISDMVEQEMRCNSIFVDHWRRILNFIQVIMCHNYLTLSMRGTKTRRPAHTSTLKGSLWVYNLIASVVYIAGSASGLVHSWLKMGLHNVLFFIVYSFEIIHVFPGMI